MLDNISEYVNVELTDDESEQRYNRCKKGGVIQGQAHKENGTGVCGRTEEEKQIHAKMGGDWSKENGVIQEVQKRSSQTEHHCPTCDKKGKGNLFLSLHFDNCGKKKKQSATREYQVLEDGVVIKKFYKRQDIYDWHPASKWVVGEILAGRRPDVTYGYTYKTINIEKNN